MFHHFVHLLSLFCQFLISLSRTRQKPQRPKSKSTQPSYYPTRWPILYRMFTLSSSRSTRLEIESSKNFPKCGKSSFLAPLELEPDDLFEVVLAAAADDARLVLRRDRDWEVGREALRRHGPHHVRVEQVLMRRERARGWMECARLGEYCHRPPLSSFG